MKIIVLQHITNGKRLFQTRIGEKMDLDRFDIHETPETCAEAILPNTQQLLVVGPIDHQSSKADEFIIRMKRKNSKLKVIGFASTGVMQECDTFVDKNPIGSTDRLLRAIRSYDTELAAA